MDIRHHGTAPSSTASAAADNRYSFYSKQYLTKPAIFVFLIRINLRKIMAHTSL
jgi:hypothetical protein